MCTDLDQEFVTQVYEVKRKNRLMILSLYFFTKNTLFFVLITIRSLGLAFKVVKPTRAWAKLGRWTDYLSRAQVGLDGLD